MVSEEIIFAPNIDERMLGKETDKVNKQLEDAGRIDPEIGDVDGGFGMGELLDGGGRGGGGFGGAAGGAALASRIPKPIAGVTASAAMPVALAGGVGVGMLSAMHGASARLQTSTTLLGQAWNNVWRPIGDRVDELFIRDAVQDLVSETQDFEEALRDGRPVEATIDLAGDLFGADAFGGRGSFADTIRRWVTSGPSFSSVVVDFVTKGPSFASMVRKHIVNAWPGWPDVSGLWPGWPDVGGLWPGWPNVGELWPGWPDLSVPNDLWPDSNDILRLFPSLSVSSLRRRILGEGNEEPQRPSWLRDGGGGGGGGGGDTTLDTNPTSPGVGGAGGTGTTGGGGGSTPEFTIDTSDLEESMEQDRRAVESLKRELSNMKLEVDGETFGRLTTETRHDSTFDTDAML